MPAADRRGLRATTERKEEALAELREIELAERKGELLEASLAVAEWAKTCSTIRDAMLAVGDRVAAQLVGKDETAIREALRMEITDALRSLSAG